MWKTEGTDRADLVKWLRGVWLPAPEEKPGLQEPPAPIGAWPVGATLLRRAER